MKSILITGGAGFIGSHTCIELLEEGYYLYVIDSFINSSPNIKERIIKLFSQNKSKFEEQFNLIKGDIKDEKLLEDVFESSIRKNRPIEAVIHFAGLKSVKESVLNPLIYWDVNVGGSITLIKLMDKYNCRTIVFSSSATVYDLNNKLPFSEDSPIKASNPYGETKITIENLFRNLYNIKNSSWRILNLRYFNPIGAHPSGILGEEPQGEINNIFPSLVKAAKGEIKELKIFGNDWPTKDGTAIRDYIHVMDLADAHCLALKYLLNKNKSEFKIINIGTGQGTTVLELIKTFESVNQCNVPFVFDNRRSGDIAASFANANLAFSILKWTPKRNLRDMCIDGWKWKRLNPYGYKKE